jgi:hypothetical protein
MASTVVTFDFALKERYNNRQTVQNLCFSDRPTLQKIMKDTEFQGSGHPVPVIIRSPLGLSVSLQNAQTNATANSGTAGNVKGVQFMVTAGDFSGSVDIGEKAIRASRANPGAFLQNKQAEIDGLYGGFSDVMAAAVQGNGTNVLGISNATVTTTTITLTNESDAMYFEQDMLLEASTASGASTSDTLLAGTCYVAGVNRNAGTITLSALPTAWNAAGVLYLFRAGTFMGDVGSFITHGFGSYVDSSSTPPALYSVTAAQRLADITRLAGVHMPTADVAGLGTEVRLQMLGARMTGRAKGPGAKYWTMHPEDWQTLAIALQSRGQRSLTDSSTSFGYQYLEVIAGGVRGEVYADRFNPKGFARAWDLPHWTLFSMGELVGPLNGDGLMMLRKSTTNDYEYRLVSFPGVGCGAPGWNGQTPV